MVRGHGGANRGKGGADMRELWWKIVGIVGLFAGWVVVGLWVISR